jgi:pimeloyl-ACP methyl ester carboxylesterase
MQNRPTPFFRESGRGPTVVCLHASASSSRQWLPLMEALGPRYHVLAVDCYGSGKSPAWRAKRPLTLRDEVALLEPVFARAHGPVMLVGHSYGAAVALIAALEHPEKVHALALYEPTMFSLVDQESPSPNEVDGFRATFAETAALLDAGDAPAAGKCFVDYWSGPGAWEQMPEARQGQVAAAMANIRGWGHACLKEPTHLSAFSWIGAPVLFMMGEQSPESSRGVGRLLARALPRVQVVDFEDLGHMGPVTHPERVNEVISRFLEWHRPFHRADWQRLHGVAARAESMG